jgi:hypothetical protein
MRKPFSRILSLGAGALLIATITGCGSSSGSASNNTQSVATERDYQATASAGDFIQFSVDADALTYSYNNVTTGHSENGSYTVSSTDSSMTFTADGATTKLQTGFEIPDLGVVLVAENTGASADKTSIVTGLPKTTVTKEEFLQEFTMNYIQFR